MEPWKKTATPEEAGLSSKGLLRYLDEVEASGVEHHSIVVLRNGMLACTMNFAPYDDTTPHILYSLSKTFTSAAAGFAVAEGLLTWNSRVADVLPDKMPDKPSKWLKSVTLHHLLTMGSGLDPKSDGLDPKKYVGVSWACGALACDCDAEPGTRFHYNSIGTYLVSAMVHRVVGMNIRDYLMPRLFEPLGIPKPEWDCCPEGICVGGWGLHLSSESVARFGLCMLQNGLWQGKQILPVEWLERATVKQIDTPDGHPDWAMGYGYQIWRTRGDRYRADGMFGQFCVVSPKDNMVVAITAGAKDTGKELDLLYEFLFPSAHMEPGTEAEQQELQRRLASLGYAWPTHDGTASHGEYTGDEVRLMLNAQEAILTTDGRTLRFGWGETAISHVASLAPGEPLVECQGVAGWQNGVLHLQMRALGGPFMLRAKATPNEQGMSLTSEGAGYAERTLQLK